MEHEYTQSVDAIRNMSTENDKWVLGDALLIEVPMGASRTLFDGVRDAAVKEGLKPLKTATLRMIRDTAHHWPPDQRIPGISFTAHRSANSADPKYRQRILLDLVKQYGEDAITKKMVFDEVISRGYSNRTTDTTIGAVEDLQPIDDMTTDSLLFLAWARRKRIDTGSVDSLLKALDTKSSGIDTPALIKWLKSIVDAEAARNAAIAKKSAGWKQPAKKKPTVKATPVATEDTEEDAEEDAEAAPKRRRIGGLRGV